VTSTPDRPGRVSPQAMPPSAPKHRPSRTRLDSARPEGLTSPRHVDAPASPPAPPKVHRTARRGASPRQDVTTSVRVLRSWHRAVASTRPPCRIRRHNPSGLLRVGTCAPPKRNTHHDSPSPRNRTCHPEGCHEPDPGALSVTARPTASLPKPTHEPGVQALPAPPKWCGSCPVTVPRRTEPYGLCSAATRATSAASPVLCSRVVPRRPGAEPTHHRAFPSDRPTRSTDSAHRIRLATSAASA
jgi:hypothetical protein